MVLRVINSSGTSEFSEDPFGYSAVKWPKLLAPGLEDKTEGERIIELRTIVEATQAEMEEDPKIFGEFFREYKQASIPFLSGWDRDSRVKFILQDVAGFAYLVDFDRGDEQGFLTYELMRNGFVNLDRKDVSYPEIYNHSRKYGPAMNTLSLCLNMKGPELKNFIFDRLPSC